MKTAAFGLLLLLVWASQGLASVTKLGQLSTGRHLAQDEEPSCVWDADEKLCKPDSSFVDKLKNAVDELLGDAKSCAKHIADGPCKENGCFWTGNECTVVQSFLDDSSEFVECFGDLAAFLEIPQNNEICRTNYTKEEPCNDTDDCRWDEDDGKCELDVLKSFGFNFLLSQGIKLVGEALGITNAPLVSLIDTWAGCKLVDDEESCLPEDGCIWDANEVDCEIGFDAVTVVVKDTFPLANSAVCLAQKAFFRSGCPNLVSEGDCNADENCGWDADLGKCTLTNAGLETEAMDEAKSQTDDLEARCAEAVTKRECEDA